ncbi:MAG TPA: ABC transporter permease [Gemmatimonadales bacterium]|jgi:predicted permease|nr:ABC transporter permease [Gemmatimonadales bacterium]
MDAFLQNLRFAVRSLRKSPTLTGAVVLTLALCIGATTAIFSVVYAVLFRPLPWADPGNVLLVSEAWRGMRGDFSVGNWADTRREDHLLQYLVPAQGASLNLSEGDLPENVPSARVGADYFRLLGVRPALGRDFAAEENQPGHDGVVILSDRLWRRRFGGDRAIVGREVRLEGQPYTVIGVMPASLDYAVHDEELWVPFELTPERLAMHDEHYLTVLGRLKPGATLQQLTAELNAIAADLQRRFPKDNAERGLAAKPFQEELIREYRPRLYVLLGAVGFVLLIACANIANLLLARAAARSHETAIRAAVGAGRGHILRQALTECLVLAAAGGVLGAFAAYWGVTALVAIGPADVPRLSQARVDGMALGFALLVTLASGLIFGIAPALRMAASFPQQALKEGGRALGAAGRRDRLRSTLVVAEIALALVLLTGAGLLIRTGIALDGVDPGFDPRNVLAARVSLPAAGYQAPEQTQRAFARFAEQLEHAPGVVAAGLVSSAPLEGGGTNGLVPEGRPLGIESAINSSLRLVTPDYFKTMRIALRRGRTFTAEDRAGAPLAMVINEELARQAWPGEDPIGKRVACCDENPDGGPAWKTVIGVVANTRARGLAEDPDPEFYLPVAQAPGVAWGWLDRTMTLAVRTSGEPIAAAGTIRDAVRAVDPTVPVYNIGTMDQRITASLSQTRFSTMLLTAFGGIALLLAAIGVYGIISYGVTQRVQEIGIRIALGAQSRDVLTMVVRHGAMLAGWGLALGLVGALVLTRLLSGLLFRVSPTDPPTFATGLVVLSFVAVLAAALPARRAALVDPVTALRSE